MVIGERVADGHRPRDLGLVAIVADAHPRLAVPVDTLEAFQETVHEVQPELFAVADHLDAGGFLLAQPLQRGTLLAALQGLAFKAPGSPELPGFG